MVLFSEFLFPLLSTAETDDGRHDSLYEKLGILWAEGFSVISSGRKKVAVEEKGVLRLPLPIEDGARAAVCTSSWVGLKGRRMAMKTRSSTKGDSLIPDRRWCPWPWLTKPLPQRFR